MSSDARAKLIAALGRAHRWLDELVTEPTASVESIAIRERIAGRSMRRTLSLVFLAPKIATAAVEGRLARGFNVTRLLDLPTDWTEQQRQLGLFA